MNLQVNICIFYVHMFNTLLAYILNFIYTCILYVHTGNKIESANQIVEWCRVHFATRDTEYNKHYFWEVKGELSYICF